MNIGVIGTGWGAALIDALSRLDIEPHLVYGHRNRDKLGHLRFTEDVDEIFGTCDAVICAVPPEINTEMVKKAAACNVGILVEKPMAQSLPAAATISKLVMDSGITFMVGHGFCYVDSIEQVSGLDITHAIGRQKRQHSARSMNPYWNLAIHHIALFDILGIEDYAIELVLDNSFTKGEHVIEFWGREGNKINFNLVGDYVVNELACFLACCQSGDTPLTDVVHGYRVIRQLSERYGNIDDCIGG